MHLGLIGYGSIAASLIAQLPNTPITRLTIKVRADSAAATRLRQSPQVRAIPVHVVTSVDDLIAAHPDLVVECAGHAAVAQDVPPLLQSGHDVVIASVGALADAQLDAEIAAAATRGSSRLIVPSGAVGGLDILRAISLHGDLELVYRGTKPPSAWKGSPAEAFLDLDTLSEATTFFSGNARDAALAFPKNANVVATLALAGGGFERMTVALIADPKATSNQHSYAVTSPICSYTMTIEGKPAAGNARTSATTALSILKEVITHPSASTV